MGLKESHSQRASGVRSNRMGPKESHSRRASGGHRSLKEPKERRNRKASGVQSNRMGQWEHCSLLVQWGQRIR